MRDWQHQQQLDEQERLEEIERLLDEAHQAIAADIEEHSVFDSAVDRAAEWRKEIGAAIGLSKTQKTDVPPDSKPF